MTDSYRLNMPLVKKDETLRLEKKFILACLLPLEWAFSKATEQFSQKS
jgi:hypothetical protein